MNIRRAGTLRSASADWCFQRLDIHSKIVEVHAGNGDDSMPCLLGKHKRFPLAAPGDTQTGFVRVRTFLRDFRRATFAGLP
jgi:hypothetical protein